MYYIFIFCHLKPHEPESDVVLHVRPEDVALEVGLVPLAESGGSVFQMLVGRLTLQGEIGYRT